MLGGILNKKICRKSFTQIKKIFFAKDNMSASLIVTGALFDSFAADTTYEAFIRYG